MCFSKTWDGKMKNTALKVSNQPYQLYVDNHKHIHAISGRVTWHGVTQGNGPWDQISQGTWEEFIRRLMARIWRAQESMTEFQHGPYRWLCGSRNEPLNKKSYFGASLVAQWLRVCLLMQGRRVRALVWEDPTCRGAAGPVSHNYWACASGACAPQRERPR